MAVQVYTIPRANYDPGTYTRDAPSRLERRSNSVKISASRDNWPQAAHVTLAVEQSADGQVWQELARASAPGGTLSNDAGEITHLSLTVRSTDAQGSPVPWAGDLRGAMIVSGARIRTEITIEADEVA